MLPEKLKGCEPALIERIENEIIDRGEHVTFDDIAGLDFAKRSVNELVCWPMARPDIFTVSGNKKIFILTKVFISIVRF